MILKKSLISNTEYKLLLAAIPFLLISAFIWSARVEIYQTFYPPDNHFTISSWYIYQFFQKLFYLFSFIAICAGTVLIAFRRIFAAWLVYFLPLLMVTFWCLETLNMCANPTPEFRCIPDEHQFPFLSQYFYFIYEGDITTFILISIIFIWLAKIIIRDSIKSGKKLL